MNPKLLKAIQNVENHWGKLDNPLADLTEVHAIASELGLMGNRKIHPKHDQFWYSKERNEYQTYNKRIADSFRLLGQGLFYKEVQARVKIDKSIVRYIDRVRKAKYNVRLLTTVE